MTKKDIEKIILKHIEEVTEKSYQEDEFGERELSVLDINSISFIKLLVKWEMEFDVEFGEDIILISGETKVKNIVDYIWEASSKSESF